MAVAFRMTMLNSLRFYITLFGSTLVFLWRQKRRRWCPVSMAAVFASGVVGMTVINYSLPNSNIKNLLVFGGALLVMIAGLIACFEVSVEDAVFCAVAGYSVQFIISLCGEIIFRLFSLSLEEYFLCQTLITAAAMPVVYLLLGRRLQRGQNMDLDRRSLLPLVVGAVLAEVVLCYNMRMRWMTHAGQSFMQSYMMYDTILLILCSVFILISQFALLVQRNLEDELKIINQLRWKDQDQYQIASETIDQINQKCHDMRHQIRTIGRSVRVTPEALAEMEQAIDIYDSMVRTGCRALDIILTEKSLYCQKNNIAIHCIADGQKLSFLQDVDIYSLFGNLLDNAIHAVQVLEEEQRMISLTIKPHGELLSVNSCNRYMGEIVMRNGVPVTNGDPRHHGFGTKSIVAIVHKYGGTISFQAKDGVFNLNMLFSLSDIERNARTS